MEINAYIHSNCFDGMGAYWAIRTFMEMKTELTKDFKVNYFFSSYGVLPKVPKDSICIFSDYYPDSVEIASEFIDNNLVIVLDHHKTALDKLVNEKVLDFGFSEVVQKYNNKEKGIYVKLDMEQSGAGITYRYFFSDTVPNMIKLIEDRDLWRFKYSESKYFHAYLSSKPFDFDVYNQILRETSTIEGMNKAIDNGKALLEYSDVLVSKICEKMRVEVINGKRVGIFNTTSHWAEVGELAVNKYNLDYSVALTLNFDEGIIKGSVRRPKGLNTIPLAERFGGGGHAGASGFSKPISFGVDALVNEIYDFVEKEK